MANTTNVRQGEIIRRLFEVLMEHSDGLPPQEAIRQTTDRMTLTEFERGEYESSPGKPRFDKILRFSTIGPMKAGWMTKSRSDGWRITDDGRAAYLTFDDPGAFMREAGRLYRVWKKDQPESPEDELIGSDSDAEVLATLEEAQDSAWIQVRSHIHAMPPYEFQNLVSALLRAMGYHVAWVAPPGPDRGIDIIAYTDPIGAEGPRIKVQVKRHTTDKKISVEDVRSFMAVLGDRDVGMYVTANSFTSNAYEEARMQETRRITLLNLEDLFDLWTRYYDQLSEEGRQLLPLRKVHFLAPED